MTAANVSLPDGGEPSGVVPAWGLEGYVAAVASAVGVSLGGVSYEVAETATAYLALDARVAGFPDADLMLMWDEIGGWRVATEPRDPADPWVVLAWLRGDVLRGDVLPSPATVGRFARRILAGGHQDPHCPFVADPPPRGRAVCVADRLAGYYRPHPGSSAMGSRSVRGDVVPPSGTTNSREGR
ncbi:MAG: DUF6292 family protein [Sciscionella sp.]